jgi:hypothetical protein
MKATCLSFFLLVVFLPMTIMAKDKCIKGNCVNGRGFLVYTEGSQYEGDWKNGKRHGQGILVLFSHDGKPTSGYTGEWRNDTMHGHGVFIWPEGYKYEGDWKDGKPHGQGTVIISAHEKYVGGWKDGMRHGQGISNNPGGSKYEGEWKEGLRHGHGVIKSADNVILEKGFYFRNIYVGEEKPEKYFWRNGWLFKPETWPEPFYRDRKK